MSTDLPSGVLAASLTPFHSDLTLDQDAFAQHVHWLLANGCDGVLLFGTTGEGLSLTVDERVAGLESLLSTDLPAEHLLVGTGALALPDAVQLAKKSNSKGCRRRTRPAPLPLPPDSIRGDSSILRPSHPEGR